MSLKSAILKWAVAVCAMFVISSSFAADIVFVHQMRGQDGEGTGEIPDAGAGTLAWEDDQWRALLEGAGHNIIAHDRFDDLDSNPGGLDVLNSGDIVIFSRDTNSGDYNEIDEQEAWTEGVTVPMIVLTPYVVRSSRWDMADATGIIETAKGDGTGILEPVDADHPIFAGALDASQEAVIWDEEILGPDDSIDFLDIFDEDGMVGNGTALAYESNLGVPWIVYWEAGVEFYEDSLLGFTAGGDRLYYSVGSDDDYFSWGEKNTTEAGDRILLNAISWLTGEDVGGVAGDFNGNGARDVADLDMLTAGVAAGDATFDLDGDGDADADDRTYWVETLSNTYLGDSNFDGEFSSADFVAVFVPAKYETGQPATWSEGDWNGDGTFGSADFVAAFVGAGYEQGPRDGGLMVVPEPSCPIIAIAGLIALVARQRRLV